MLETTADGIKAVMAPKAAGAWALHGATAADPLDFFVLFSSASALLGLPGQANYAAANAFLDGLARHRRQLGRPALSIAWGRGRGRVWRRSERIAASGWRDRAWEAWAPLRVSKRSDVSSAATAPTSR